jgi:ADP-ribose pyrophosphatase YjhB (NUDIX family)
MYLSGEILAAVERTFGRPAVARAEAEFTPRSFALLEHCGRKDRAHDVTLFIRDEAERYAVIRKPSYPSEVFRPPSGGVEPGEPFETGAHREAAEETGLVIVLERYVLRVEARFTCQGRVAPWTTHIVTARATGGTLEPLDRVEIEEARWATVEELVHRYRPLMLAMGSAGMRYRVDLQDLTLRLLGLADPPEPEGGRIVREIES